MNMNHNATHAAPTTAAFPVGSVFFFAGVPESACSTPLRRALVRAGIKVAPRYGDKVTHVVARRVDSNVPVQSRQGRGNSRKASASSRGERMAVATSSLVDNLISRARKEGKRIIMVDGLSIFLCSITYVGVEAMGLLDGSHGEPSLDVRERKWEARSTEPVLEDGEDVLAVLVRDMSGTRRPLYREVGGKQCRIDYSVPPNQSPFAQSVPAARSVVFMNDPRVVRNSVGRQVVPEIPQPKRRKVEGGERPTQPRKGRQAFCECCRESFASSVAEHEQSSKHRMFAENSANYTKIDKLFEEISESTRRMSATTTVVSPDPASAMKPMEDEQPPSEVVFLLSESCSPELMVKKEPSLDTTPRHTPARSFVHDQPASPSLVSPRVSDREERDLLQKFFFTRVKAIHEAQQAEESPPRRREAPLDLAELGIEDKDDDSDLMLGEFPPVDSTELFPTNVVLESPPPEAESQNQPGVSLSQEEPLRSSQNEDEVPRSGHGLLPTRTEVPISLDLSGPTLVQSLKVARENPIQRRLPLKIPLGKSSLDVAPLRPPSVIERVLDKPFLESHSPAGSAGLVSLESWRKPASGSSGTLQRTEKTEGAVLRVDDVRMPNLGDAKGSAGVDGLSQPVIADRVPVPDASLEKRPEGSSGSILEKATNVEAALPGVGGESAKEQARSISTATANSSVSATRVTAADESDIANDGGMPIKVNEPAVDAHRRREGMRSYVHMQTVATEEKTVRRPSVPSRLSRMVAERADHEQDEDNKPGVVTHHSLRSRGLSRSASAKENDKEKGMKHKRSVTGTQLQEDQDRDKESLLAVATRAEKGRRGQAVAGPDGDDAERERHRPVTRSSRTAVGSLGSVGSKSAPSVGRDGVRVSAAREHPKSPPRRKHKTVKESGAPVSSNALAGVGVSRFSVSTTSASSPVSPAAASTLSASTSRGRQCLVCERVATSVWRKNPRNHSEVWCNGCYARDLAARRKSGALFAVAKKAPSSSSGAPAMSSHTSARRSTSSPPTRRVVLAAAARAAAARGW